MALRSADVSTANALATLRYGGQARALSAAQQEVERGYRTSITEVRSQMNSAMTAIKALGPELEKAYAELGVEQGRLQSQLRQDFQALSPAADRYKAIGANEMARASRRLSEGLTQARQDLVNQRSYIAQRAQQQVGDLGLKAASDLEKIRQRKLDMVEQLGAFITAQTEKLRTQRAERGIKRESIRQRERASVRTATTARERNRTTRAHYKATGIRAGRADRRAAAKETREAAKDRYLREHGLSTYAPPASRNRRGAKETEHSHSLKLDIDHVRGVIQSKRKQNKSFGGIKNSAITKGKISPVVYTAAEDLVRYGYVKPGTRARLRNVGVTDLPRSWVHPKRPRRTGVTKGRWNPPRF